MSVETQDLNQKAVLWVKTGTDQYNRDTYGSPIEIPCRWEDRTDQIKLSSGELITTSSRIMVDREIELESLVRLGKLSALPGTPNNLHEVVMKKVTPDLDGELFQITILTQRYSGSV